MQVSDHSCGVSPFCGSADDVLGALRLPADLPWRWAHLGPITVNGVCLVEHQDGAVWTRTQVLEPGPALARFGGYHLDVLGLTSPPTALAASYHALLKLWYAYAVAWRSADGPRVEWRGERFGPGLFTTHQPAGALDGEVIAGRCKDLLLGRFVRRGRPPKTEAAVHDGLALALLAEDMKRRSPRRSRAAIARDLGTDERTMRRYRAEARRLGVLADDVTRRLA